MASRLPGAKFLEPRSCCSRRGLRWHGAQQMLQPHDIRERRRLTERRYDAVVFDLLTALIDSWTLWNAAAGSEADGLRWRRKYLELTYGQGAYRAYEDIVRAAA